MTHRPTSRPSRRRLQQAGAGSSRAGRGHPGKAAPCQADARGEHTLPAIPGAAAARQAGAQRGLRGRRQALPGGIHAAYRTGRRRCLTAGGAPRAEARPCCWVMSRAPQATCTQGGLTYGEVGWRDVRHHEHHKRELGLHCRGDGDGGAVVCLPLRGLQAAGERVQRAGGMAKAADSCLGLVTVLCTDRAGAARPRGGGGDGGGDGGGEGGGCSMPALPDSRPQRLLAAPCRLSSNSARFCSV